MSHWLSGPHSSLSACVVQEFVRVREHRESDREAIVLALTTRTFKKNAIIFFEVSKGRPARFSARLGGRRGVCGVFITPAGSSCLKIKPVHGSFSLLILSDRCVVCVSAGGASVCALMSGLRSTSRPVRPPHHSASPAAGGHGPQSKRHAHRMFLVLSLSGLSCAELHGNLSQGQRLEALDRFRRKEVDILLATDLASRGLDIPGVEAVVNVRMPKDLATYVHRVGRTGAHTLSRAEAHAHIHAHANSCVRAFICTRTAVRAHSCTRDRLFALHGGCC
jgi:hypothetical protein